MTDTNKSPSRNRRGKAMTEAPETIWIDTSGGNWSGVSGGTQGEEYHRADLPLTNAQLEADERVRALVDALEQIRDRHVPDQPAADGAGEVDYIRKHHLELRIMARSALAQLKETKP